MQDTFCLAGRPERKTHYVLQEGRDARHIVSCTGAGAQDALFLAGEPGRKTHYVLQGGGAERKTHYVLQEGRGARRTTWPNLVKT